MPRKGGHAPKKAPGTAVDKRNGRKLELKTDRLERFDPPPSAGPEARTAWEAYWDDPVSTLATPADRSLLLRWLELIDRYAYFMRKAMEKPVIAGSTGQERANPFFTLATQTETAISRIEAQLGIGPRNRAALGIAVLSERKTLADLNAELTDNGSGGRAELDGDEDEDPRATARG